MKRDATGRVQVGRWRRRLANEPLLIRIPDFRRQPSRGRHVVVEHRHRNVGLVVLLVMAAVGGAFVGSPRLRPLRDLVTRYLIARHEAPATVVEASRPPSPVLPVKPLVVRLGPVLEPVDPVDGDAPGSARGVLRNSPGAALEDRGVPKREWR